MVRDIHILLLLVCSRVNRLNLHEDSFHCLVKIHVGIVMAGVVSTMLP